MNCDWVAENITLYLYDELPDDLRYELERHLERCAACAAELEAARDFKAALFQDSVAEPTANLLAAARMRLQEALETAEPYRGWQRWILEPAHWLRPIKLAPATAALLLIVGFGAGAGAAYRLASTVRTSAGHSPLAPAPAEVTALAEASILGIRGIAQRPDSAQVDISYDMVTPQSVTGTPDDPRIRQLLLFAARNNANSGLRVDSVDLLAQRPGDERVRQALAYALQYDSNPGVRLRALQALGPYVKGDLRTRDAVLSALLNDRNPGVRIQAIQLLAPVRADASVRQALESLAGKGTNAPVGRLSRSVLESTPPID
jgi:hypothetical protein